MKTLLRYPGSKWNLANRIVAMLPNHKSYLEPFFGSGAVLFNKTPSSIETVNDLNGDIVNLFEVIKKQPKRLCDELYFTPYSRQVYDAAFETEPADEIEKALNFIIKSVMSHGFRTVEKSGWKNDINGRERAYAVKHWNDLPEIVLEMTERLKQVQIEHRPALDLMGRFDKEDVCMYLDPPYILSTRTRVQYSHEMSDADHEQLLDFCVNSKAKILLSGYDHWLYDEYLDGWNRYEFDATAEQGLKRKEILWVNFEAPGQMRLL